MIRVVGIVGPQEGVSDGVFVVRLSGGFEGTRVGGSGSSCLVGDVVEGGHGCAFFKKVT